MGAISIRNVVKRYGAGPKGNQVIHGVNAEIADGEFIVIVGPSGCGKSTLLRMVAGLEEISGGEIAIAGRVVNDVEPAERDIAMVFQNYALYPHMSVRENLGFGLSVRRTPKREIARRVEDVAALLGLESLLERKPAKLSGGQRQRVAMGRAIIREPKAYLMDEPLSNLDAKLRVGMRASLAELHARLAVTSIYVTHDQTEAMTLGQRVAVMRDGRIVQVDAPQRLYQDPADLFVASFIGSPSMNLVDAGVEGDEIVFGQFRVPLDPQRRPPPGVERVTLGVRPEAFESGAHAGPGLPRIVVAVDVLEELGSDAFVVFRVGAPRISVETRDASDDEEILLAEDGSRFTARVNPTTDGRVGAPLELAVDPAQFHFFDLRTGTTLRT